MHYVAVITNNLKGLEIGQLNQILNHEYDQKLSNIYGRCFNPFRPEVKPEYSLQSWYSIRKTAALSYLCTCSISIPHVFHATSS
jgi:hypothetical protein